MLRWTGSSLLEQGSWGQHGAHLGPTGPRWAPSWPHEHCYLGIDSGNGLCTIGAKSSPEPMLICYQLHSHYFREIFIKRHRLKNAFEKAVRKKSLIMSWPQCVDSSSACLNETTSRDTCMSSTDSYQSAARGSKAQMMCSTLGMNCIWNDL